MLRNIGADSYLMKGCYTNWGFGTWTAIGQYTTYSFYFSSRRKTILTNFFPSLLPTLFNRRGDSSICCTWLEPGMRELSVTSLPGTWLLWSPCYSHGTARLELQWKQQTHEAATANRSRAAKTACKVIFSGLKWFPPSWVWALLQSRRSFSLTFSPPPSGFPLPFSAALALLTTWVPSTYGVLPSYPLALLSISHNLEALWYTMHPIHLIHQSYLLWSPSFQM